MTLPQAIFFDHDGTLVDSEGVHFTLWQQILSDYGKSLDETLYSTVMAGVPLKQNAIDVVGLFSLDVSPYVLEQQKMSFLARYLRTEAFPLLPGVGEVLNQCRDLDIPMAIVTGGARMAVERTIEAHSLQDSILFAVAAEDVTESKPSPECYTLAINKLSATPSLACAVEDTCSGLTAASRAGLPCDVIPNQLSKNQDFSLARARYKTIKEWAANTLPEPSS